MTALLDGEHYIAPSWPRPAAVSAVLTTCGGIELDEANGYGNNNLALHVGDDPARVESNRQSLCETMAVDAIQWMQQVHGNCAVVVEQCSAQAPEADALYSSAPGVALGVLTADCLPVLLCDCDGSEIAVAHAGWRGLAAGVLDNTLKLFKQPVNKLTAYLGPAISQQHFEVGAEVRAAFVEGSTFAHIPQRQSAFSPSSRAGYFQCDLYALARMQLQAAGVLNIYGGEYCSYRDRTLFYSYRRQPVCGRMACIIALRDTNSP